MTARGTRYSRDSARHHLSELFRFFRWLDQSEKFGWTAPKGLSSISRKVPKFDSERSRSSAGKPIYTAEQLICLNENATALERLCLYLALNCAMGAAELGRIRLANIDKQQHPYAHKLRFESSPDDTFLRFDRPKTEVFGEWLLWEPVARQVEWGVKRAKQVGSDLLFCYGNGTPIYAEVRSKNAQQGFANIWHRLVNRVRKGEPGFPSLPFGTLRDTLPDTMRHEFDGELASLLLCHGSPVASDTLLECYTGKPFGRLHDATRKLFEVYRPMFDAVDEPTEERKRFYTAETIEVWRSQRASGIPVPAIAADAGVSVMTVYRHTSPDSDQAEVVH